MGMKSTKRKKKPKEPLTMARRYCELSFPRYFGYSWILPKCRDMPSHSIVFAWYYEPSWLRYLFTKDYWY